MAKEFDPNKPPRKQDEYVDGGCGRETVEMVAALALGVILARFALRGRRA